ncbi:MULTISPECIES: hypothetical protein [unclassified Cupriavidus]|uniref:hypothetical protein n=1 Tax=Cupriavidus sp. H19C3 TaxID=3241603 RepID=UPI0011DB733D|nr:MAG: hypothetical protein E6Q40_16215 [Cupriavidus sp.]
MRTNFIKLTSFLLVAIATGVGAASAHATEMAAHSGDRSVYLDGARLSSHDVFTDGARNGQRDPYLDGARVNTPRDEYTDGA